MTQEPEPASRRPGRLLREATWPRWFAFVAGLGVIVAIAVGQGRTKTWFGLVALSAALVLSNLGRGTRFKVLLLAVLSTPLLFGASLPIPAQFTLSESLLVFVVVGEALSELHPSRAASTKSTLGARYYAPFALFALVGLASTYVNGELLTYWPEVCLMPLLALFAIDRLAASETTALTLIKAAVTAIFAYVAIIWVAQVTGRTYTLPGGGGGVVGRFANGRGISLGPLSFGVWSIDVGSLAALGIPAAILLALGTRGRVARLMFAAIALVLAATLALTGARGAMIAAAAGTVLALLVSRRLTLWRAIVTLVALAIVLIIAGPALVRLLPPAVVSSVAALGGGLGSIPDFHIRLGIWQVTLDAVMRRPLGPGFNYLYNMYGLDQWSVAYAMILSGTGILGLCALGVMLFQLACRFLSGLLSRAAGLDADLAAIGLGTMATALLASVSAASVLVGPVDPIVFWTIMAAAAVGLAKSAFSANVPGLSDTGVAVHG